MKNIPIQEFLNFGEENWKKSIKYIQKVKL